MFHRTTLFVAFVALVSGLRALAETSTLAYDNTYDDGSLSLDRVACSDGANGLITKGYSTLGSLHNFPNLGGVSTVTGWNSTACGACYAVTYKGTTVNILAVDVSKEGFTVSEAAMNALTNQQASQAGRITVDYSQVDSSKCLL